MKTYATLTASALIVASTINSASALKKYCDGLPNATRGRKRSVRTSYAADTSMTNGAVFGDPCCTWKAGCAKGETSKTTPSAETNTKGETPETKQSAETNTKGETPETKQSAETNTKGETPETKQSAETNTKGETPETTKDATKGGDAPKAGSPPGAPAAGGGCASKSARKLRF
ncbi:unnamed protein product [Peronospora destructor]|uniref:Uncharacterized protein n=1 Tax=Peronospora destructor TaxID=86335 RepID=A0AAV0U4M0_9STRA|nr:unnamed protein product [Peronospora destructor]